MKNYRLSAGVLRHQVYLQSKAETGKSASGQPTYTWTTYATVMAKIMPRRAEEAFAGDQLEETVTHYVWIRYRSGVTHKHRVLFGARIFDIKGVKNPGEANQALVLECTEDTD